MLNLGLGSSKFMLVSSGGGGEAASFLLDDYSGAAAAYSVRKLNSSYTGACMRVREDSGDTELDIGFDSNGLVDTSAIATHCGAANGFVVTWYGQEADGKGNGNDATQSTNASQPQIYNGTAVITENGKPAVRFKNQDNSGVNRWLDCGDVGDSTGDICTFVVLNHNNSTLSLQYGSPFSKTIFAAGASRWSTGPTLGAYIDSSNSPTNVTNQTTRNTQILYAHEALGGDTITMYENGTAQANTGSPSGSVGNSAYHLLVGGYGDAAGNGGAQDSLRGVMQEAIYYNSDQSSNRTAIETDINSEYLIYQPTDTPTSGLLATYSGAAAAYSVRQLADTALLAMTVRRDSDDEEQRFGFDENGDLDTAGIASFCGNSEGYVSKWWDQSTNGNHASQATFGNQPQIYNGTAVITENGKPILRSISNSQLVMPINTQGAYDIYSTSKIDGKSIYMGNDASGNDFLLAAESGSTSTAIKSGTVTINSSRKNGASHTFGNRGAIFTNFSAQHLMYLDVDFSFNSGASHLYGYDINLTWRMWSAQEVVIYPNTVTHTPSDVETNINDYFSIFTP